jgi:hypothetical protein
LSEDQTIIQHHKQYLNSIQTELGIGFLKSLVLKELIRSAHSYNADQKKKNKQKLKNHKKKGKGI